ncbi:hypothetical protein FKM82_001315 [Ascaphus truei]
MKFQHFFCPYPAAILHAQEISCVKQILLLLYSSNKDALHPTRDIQYSFKSVYLGDSHTSLLDNSSSLSGHLVNLGLRSN